MAVCGHRPKYFFDLDLLPKQGVARSDLATALNIFPISPEIVQGVLFAWETMI